MVVAPRTFVLTLTVTVPFTTERAEVQEAFEEYLGSLPGWRGRLVVLEEYTDWAAQRLARAS